MTPALTCSVVICTRSRPQHLHICLEALETQRGRAQEILIVDNAPGRGNAEGMAQKFGTRYVHEPSPGASMARNRGAQEARCDIIAYVDDDAAPEPGWLDEITRPFVDAEVMAVTGRAILPAGLPQAPEENVRYVSLDHNDPHWFEISAFGGLGNGMNMAFRRTAWQVWSGFDARLGPGTPLGGCEELYAFLSLVERGCRVVYTPAAVVRHPTLTTLPRLQERFFEDTARGAAFMMFLLAERPQYCLALLRYTLQSLAGKQRPWRQSVYPSHIPLPANAAWKVRLARLRGPLLFLRTWRFCCARQQEMPAPGSSI